MVLVGMIQIPNQEEKNQWIEISSQILNALFTLAALINHPIRFIALYYFFKDQEKLKKKYDWYHPESDYNANKKFLFLMVILHANCFFQYPITVAMWAFPPTTRPQLIIPICLPISFLCALGGGILETYYRKEAKKIKCLDELGQLTPKTSKKI